MASEEAKCLRDQEVKQECSETQQSRRNRKVFSICSEFLGALFEVMKSDEGVSAEEAKTKVDNKVNDQRVACDQNGKPIFVFRSQRAVGTMGVNKNKSERHSQGGKKKGRRGMRLRDKRNVTGRKRAATPINIHQLLPSKQRKLKHHESADVLVEARALREYDLKVKENAGPDRIAGLESLMCRWMSALSIDCHMDVDD